MDQKVKNARILFKVLALFTLMFFVMSFVYGGMTGTTSEIWPKFLEILRTPAQCTQDMYGYRDQREYDSKSNMFNSIIDIDD